MTCRGCGHAYPVSNGIPNMVSQKRGPFWVIRREERKTERKANVRLFCNSCSLSTRLADELHASFHTLDSCCIVTMMHISLFLPLSLPPSLSLPLREIDFILSPSIPTVTTAAAAAVLAIPTRCGSAIIPLATWAILRRSLWRPIIRIMLRWTTWSRRHSIVGRWWITRWVAVVVIVVVVGRRRVWGIVGRNRWVIVSSLTWS